jgi:hypothetical protein
MSRAALMVVGFSVDIGTYVALVGSDNVDICGRQWCWSTGANVGGH